MLVVAAFGARGETEMAFDTNILNSSRMNVIALAEAVGALLITQADFPRRLLGTVRLTGGQWRTGFWRPSCCSSAGRPVSGSRAEQLQPGERRRRLDDQDGKPNPRPLRETARTPRSCHAPNRR
jgi:hypothetical protein